MLHHLASPMIRLEEAQWFVRTCTYTAGNFEHGHGTLDLVLRPKKGCVSWT